MHDSVIQFVLNTITGIPTEQLRHARVLEVGSYDVNGGVRQFIEPRVAHYWGIDVASGPGVDQVMNAEQMPLDWAGAYDLVISTEVLEHVERPWLVVSEMARVLAVGGTLIVTARGFDSARGAFFFHNPPDRWRFTCDGMRPMITDTGLLVVTCHDDPQVPGVFTVAQRFAFSG